MFCFWLSNLPDWSSCRWSCKKINWRRCINSFCWSRTRRCNSCGWRRLEKYFRYTFNIPAFVHKQLVHRFTFFWKLNTYESMNSESMKIWGKRNNPILTSGLCIASCFPIWKNLRKSGLSFQRVEEPRNSKVTAPSSAWLKRKSLLHAFRALQTPAASLIWAWVPWVQAHPTPSQLTQTCDLELPYLLFKIPIKVTNSAYASKGS